MTQESTIHVIDGGLLRLPCGTTIAWSTHKYSSDGNPVEYTTEINISVDGNDVARIDACPADVAYGVVMSHTTIYGVEHKEPMQIAPDQEYWKIADDTTNL